LNYADLIEAEENRPELSQVLLQEPLNTAPSNGGKNSGTTNSLLSGATVSKKQNLFDQHYNKKVESTR
jgi:hypothetical protein